MVGALLSFVWWLSLRGNVEAAPSNYELLIPTGTAALVAQGAKPPSIPSTIRIKDDGSIIIRNRDTVAHTVGNWTILPGEDREVALDSLAPTGPRNSFLCSVHPGGAVGLSFDKVPPLTANLVPTFAIGLPLGLAGFGVLLVTTRLD